MTDMKAEPQDVIDFWVNEVGPKGWYNSTAELDAEIRDRFEPLWEEARAGRLARWQTHATGMLAFLLLTDQFPRNMFRDTAKAFSTDKIALSAAKQAIEKGWDMRIDEPARQFFYLPLMHSENLCDQDRCVRLMCERMPESGDNLLHARVHRQIIRDFGRFPYRNEALSRSFTKPEKTFVEEGGYARILKQMQADRAAA